MRPDALGLIRWDDFCVTNGDLLMRLTSRSRKPHLQSELLLGYVTVYQRCNGLAFG